MTCAVDVVLLNDRRLSKLILGLVLCLFEFIVPCNRNYSCENKMLWKIYGFERDKIEE